jgi:hypothetical protein
VADIVWESAGGRELYEDTATQFLAWNATHPPLTDSEPSEVLVQLAVRDADDQKINHRFGVQVVPRVLASVPGITYLADQGRPRAAEVVGYWPTLITRDRVPMRVMVGDDETLLPAASPPRLGLRPQAPPERGLSEPRLPEPRGSAPRPAVPPEGAPVTVALSRLCLARSGDKGDMANIGLVARTPAVYAWVVDNITPEFVKARFGEMARGAVERFELPNLLAVNFLLHDSLGGGGTLSLLVDAQGKTYGQYLLAAPVEVPEALLEGVD